MSTMEAEMAVETCSVIGVHPNDAPDPEPETRYLCDSGWGMDAALELWVDTETKPVSIRLAGVLDHFTCTSVGPIVEELLAEGYRDFMVTIDGLETSDATGFCTLLGMLRLVTAAGGSLHWSTWPTHGSEMAVGNF
jgi:hypothetical protein